MNWELSGVPKSAVEQEVATIMETPVAMPFKTLSAYCGKHEGEVHIACDSKQHSCIELP